VGLVCGVVYVRSLFEDQDRVKAAPMSAELRKTGSSSRTFEAEGINGKLRADPTPQAHD